MLNSLLSFSINLKQLADRDARIAELDGKIRSITFKNGIEHRFVCKQKEA